MKVEPRTKAFKDWNKQFSRQELIVVRQEYLKTYTVLDRWPHEVEQWVHEEVRGAVYEAEDTEDWQRFRVAMKGLTTQEKLGMLNNYFEKFVDRTTDGNVEWPKYKCRIDNYIGALVRGGQLNSNLEIAK